MGRENHKTLASHLCGPGSATSGLSWLLVLYSAPRGFSPGFLLSSKVNICKFQFERMQDLPENHFRLSGASWVNITN